MSSTTLCLLPRLIYQGVVCLIGGSMGGERHTSSQPPITSTVAYLISHTNVFLVNFHQISVLILLYIQHIYVFYHYECANADAFIMRRKTIIWKLILTFFILFLNCPEVPGAYKMLAKGANYDR